MVLTLFLWIGIYDGNSDSISHYMLNAAINRTTGNEIIDGLVLRFNHWIPNWQKKYSTYTKY